MSNFKNLFLNRKEKPGLQAQNPPTWRQAWTHSRPCSLSQPLSRQKRTTCPWKRDGPMQRKLRSLFTPQWVEEIARMRRIDPLFFSCSMPNHTPAGSGQWTVNDSDTPKLSFVGLEYFNQQTNDFVYCPLSYPLRSLRFFLFQKQYKCSKYIKQYFMLTYFKSLQLNIKKELWLFINVKDTLDHDYACILYLFY